MNHTVSSREQVVVYCPDNVTVMPSVLPFSQWSYYQWAGLVYSNSFVLYLVLSLTLMFARRSHFPIRRARKPGLVLISAIGTAMHLVIGPIREVVGEAVFPCEVLLVLGSMFLPLTLSPTLIRLVLYRRRVAIVEREKRNIANQLHFQQGKVSGSENSLYLMFGSQRSVRLSSEDDGDTIVTQSTATPAEHQQSISNPAEHQESTTTLKQQRQRPTLEVKGAVSGSEIVRRGSPIRRGSGGLSNSIQTLLSHIRTNAFLTGTRFSAILVTLSTLPFVVVSVVLFDEAPFGEGCTGCGFLETNLIFIFIAIFSVVSIWTLWTVKDVTDAVGLKYEMVSVFGTLLVGGSIWFTLVLVDPDDLEASGTFSYSYILSLILGIIHYRQCITPILVSFNSNQVSHLREGQTWYKSLFHTCCTWRRDRNGPKPNSSYISSPPQKPSLAQFPRPVITRKLTARARAGTGNSYGLVVPGEFTITDIAGIDIQSPRMTPPPSPSLRTTGRRKFGVSRMSSSVSNSSKGTKYRRMRTKNRSLLRFLVGPSKEARVVGAPWRDSGRTDVSALSLASSQPPSREPSWRNRMVTEWSNTDTTSERAMLDSTTHFGPSGILSGELAAMESSSMVAGKDLLAHSPTLGHISLEGVLENDRLRGLYMKHLYSELSSESLLFWEEVHFMKEKWANEDLVGDAVVQRRFKRGAKALYKTFITTTSVLQVNIGYECRKDLERQFRDKSAILGIEVFDDAVREIEDMLEGDSFPRFIRALQEANPQDII